MQSTAAAAVSARKYKFRKRVLTAMVALMAGGLSFTVSPTPKRGGRGGVVAGVLVLYPPICAGRPVSRRRCRRRQQAHGALAAQFR